MTVTDTEFDGLKIIDTDQYKDARGEFFETYNYKKYNTELTTEIFVQDNCSLSHKNVLRGLHFQIPPFAQSKLVYVLSGKVIDVVLDLRKESKTFGQCSTFKLSKENGRQLFIPRGFAHGFCTLEDHTIFAYKCDNFYNKEAERTILWNDIDLNIDWPNENWTISEKDQDGIPFSDFVSPF